MNPNIAVIGTGYLGATHAACLAELGFDVLGVDTDPVKVDRARPRRVPRSTNPDWPTCSRRHTASGRLRFTTSPAEAARVRRRALPLRRHPAAHRRAGRRHSVTSMPGGRRSSCRTCGGLRSSSASPPCRSAPRTASRRVRRSWPGPASSVEVAWNPEFLREGLRGRGHAVSGPAGLRRRVRPRPRSMLRAVYARQLDQGVPLVVDRPRRRPSW